METAKHAKEEMCIISKEVANVMAVLSLRADPMIEGPMKVLHLIIFRVTPLSYFVETIVGWHTHSMSSPFFTLLPSETTPRLLSLLHKFSFHFLAFLLIPFLLLLLPFLPFLLLPIVFLFNPPLPFIH